MNENQFERLLGAIERIADALELIATTVQKGTRRSRPYVRTAEK